MLPLVIHYGQVEFEQPGPPFTPQDCDGFSLVIAGSGRSAPPDPRLSLSFAYIP